MPEPPERTIHWAKRGRTGVITCAGGRTHVLVLRRSKRLFEIFITYEWGSRGRLISSCETWATAKRRAERLARKIGVDELAYDGTLRGRPMTARQVQIMKQHGIVHQPNLTIGEAGDLIALSIAEGFDPDLCAD